jgi:hypothetical protein
MHLSMLAPETFPAWAKTCCRNPYARFNALYLRTYFHNIAAEFMPEDGACLTITFVYMQIGAADAAGLDFDNYTVGFTYRIRHSFCSDIFCSMHYRSFHIFPLYNLP